MRTEDHLAAAQAALTQASALICVAQQHLDAMQPPPEPPAGDYVPASADLIGLLAAAAPGAVFRLDPAGCWALSHYTLTKPVTLRTDAPLAEGRVSPATLPGPTLVGFLTMQAPDVTLCGLRVEGPYPEGTLVTCGDRTVLDRCVIIGSPTGQHRGVRTDAAGVQVLSCHIANIHKDQDTQAVTGWDGCRQLLVRDCYLEASGENIIFGGADAASAERMPHDIVIEDCHLTKQLAWRDRPDAVCKNLFELKAARNVVMRRCTLEYSWRHGQDGFGIVLTPRNQDGGATWSTVEHVRIEDCQLAHLGSGVQVLGDDYTHPSGRMTDVELLRCHFTDIDPWIWGGAGRLFQISRGPQQFRIRECTFAGQHLNSCLTFEDPCVPCADFVVERTTMPSGEYAIKCSEVAMGTPTLDLYCPGYVWQDVTILQGSNCTNWPPGTTLV